MREFLGHPVGKGTGSGGIRHYRIRSGALTVPNPVQTVKVLTELMGFRYKGQYDSPVDGQPDILVLRQEKAERERKCT